MLPLLAVALLLTVGLLALGIARLHVGLARSSLTALAFAVGGSLSVLALTVAAAELTPQSLSTNARYAPYVIATLSYIGVVGWFLAKRTPPSSASLVISAFVAAFPLAYASLFVALSVSCALGNCI